MYFGICPNRLHVFRNPRSTGPCALPEGQRQQKCFKFAARREENCGTKLGMYAVEEDRQNA